MKECLVIVLMFGLTGMVFGKQSGSNSVFENTRTDSTRVTSPTPPLTSSRLPSQAPTTDSVERIMKLDINAGMIDAIKSGQILEAPIDLQDVTNGIVMMFDDPTTLKPRVDEIPRNLKPDFVSGNGVLHFTLDEVGLERLRTEGLQYEYLPGEKGDYKQVSLKYVPSSGARTPVAANPSDLRSDNDSLFPASDNRLANDRQPIRRNDALSREDFGNPPLRTNQDLPLSTAKTDSDRFFEQQRLLDRQREIDRQREETRQTEIDRQVALDRQRELDRQRQVDTSRTFGIDRSRDNRDTNTHTFQLTDRDIDALATSTNQIRTERERREAELERMQLEKLAAERRAQLADADRTRLLDKLNGRSRFDETPLARRRTLDDGLYTSYGQRRQFPSQRDLTRTSLSAPYGSGLVDRYPDRVATSDSSRLQLQEAALENERLRLQLARAETDRTRLATENRLADLRGNAANDTSQRDANQRSPLQLSDYNASIPGSRPRSNQQPQGTNPPAPLTSYVGAGVTATSVDNMLHLTSMSEHCEPYKATAYQAGEKSIY